MLDLRIPSGWFFAALGAILAVYSVAVPDLHAPLTVGNVNLYSGAFMLVFGGVLLLLSRRPATIAEDVVFDAARPRTDATLSEPGFVRVKAHCLDVFQREVLKAKTQPIFDVRRREIE